MTTRPSAPAVRRTTLAIALVVITGCTSGCAFGNKHRYRDADVALQASGATAVVVAVTDQRPYILDGDKRPDFVGLQRGGYGNPFDVTTESGKPLADDMASSICAALTKKGRPCTPSVSVGADAASARAAALAACKSSGSQRLLLITIREWKADTYNDTSLYFDVSAEVLDSTGALLAQNRIQGSEEIEGSLLNPPAAAKENVPLAYRRKIEQLLNTPPMLAALGPESPPE